MPKKQEVAQEKHQFQTEVKQLLHLFIHSLYSKKEIFVRELISNGADALDKVRFIQLTSDEEILDKDAPLEINITLDEEAGTFTIRDNGLGMTKEELITNIGTIAKSGSLEFIKKLKEQKKEADVNLIGQFGVGFYSIFMVGSNVTLRTRSYKKDEQAYEWISEGEAEYVLNPIDKADRGTEITVKLNDDCKEFATRSRIEGVIKEHSNFVEFDIKVNGEKVNHESAIWARPKAELKDEEYVEFYKYLTNSSNPPLATIHTSVEGNLQFKSILYVPDKNYEMQGFGKIEHGLALYCNKVLIIPDCKKLLPQYLRFVRGVVDSEDISLNVSREMLQDSAVMHSIQSNLVKKVLDELKKMAKSEPEKYTTFWKEFGRIMKEGTTADFLNRDKLIDLLRFNSSTCADSEGLVSLREYVDRFTEGQKEIYYISGIDRETVERSPHLEIFRKKGIEVLYLTDPMDDFVLSSVMRYDEKDIKSVDQANLDSVKEIKKEEEKVEIEDKESEGKFNELVSYFKTTLGDKVTNVVKSYRLTDSPCILVNSDGSVSSHMQNVMKMIDKNYKVAPKVLELNADHPVIKNLESIYQKDPREEFLKEAVFQLYETSMFQDGVVPDPKETAPRILRTLEKASGWYLAMNEKAS